MSNHPLAGARTRRQILGIRAVDIARELGVEPSTFTRYEDGSRPISFAKALTLCRILHNRDPRLMRYEPASDEIYELHAIATRLKAGEIETTIPAHLPQLDASNLRSPTTPGRPAKPFEELSPKQQVDRALKAHRMQPVTDAQRIDTMERHSTVVAGSPHTSLEEMMREVGWTEDDGLIEPE